jgi:hypothetical protein
MRRRRDHLRALPTSENSFDNFAPRLDSAAMMNTAIKLLINAYSIAVAPESSLKKVENWVFMALLLVFRVHGEGMDRQIAAGDCASMDST